MKERTILAPEGPLAKLNKPAPASADNSSARAMSPQTTGLEHTQSSILKIPLSRLRIHPFNSRIIRSQERIEDVKEMLEAEHLQREPITVVPGRSDSDKGFFYILSGQTRFHAAILAGWPDLNAQINESLDPNDHFEFWSASLEHNASIPETDWDLAIKAKALIEEGVKSDKIQKALRRDSRGLRRLSAMTELPESVLSLVRSHPIKLTARFCEVLRSGVAALGDEAISDLAKSVVYDDLSCRALQDSIDRAVRKKKSETAASAKRSIRVSMTPVMVGAAKAGEFKVMQSRDQGKKMISLTANVPEDLVEAFRSDIKAAIERLGGLK